jgi:hypothetical protein
MSKPYAECVVRVHQTTRRVVHPPIAPRRSLLYLQPAAELRRVDDAGDVGPARHQQQGHLGVPPLGVGLLVSHIRGDRSRTAAARLDAAPEERAAGEELVGQVAGKELVAASAPSRGQRQSRLHRLGFSRRGGQPLCPQLPLLALAEGDTRRFQLLAERHINGSDSPRSTSAQSP